MKATPQELKDLNIEPVMSLDSIATALGVSRKTVSDVLRDGMDKIYIACHELDIQPEDLDR